jgi:hypothetical protein
MSRREQGGSPTPEASGPRGRHPATGAFQVKDCALIALATGMRAQNLRELSNGLQGVDAGSIYYHFWGARLRPRFDDPEYQNDFAAWARHALHDGKMAERLGVIDPTDFATLDELRHELIDVIEERLDEGEGLAWSRPDQQFNFTNSEIVVFDTNRVIEEPEELVPLVAQLSPSSIFYHVIDARRRTPDSIDDFRAWLYGFGDLHRDLCDRIAGLDPFFPTLTELRDSLASLLRRYFGRQP